MTDHAARLNELAYDYEYFADQEMVEWIKAAAAHIEELENALADAQQDIFHLRQYLGASANPEDGAS